MEYQSYSIVLYYCIASGAAGYLSSYLKEKAKYRAAREDIARVENEKQGIIQKYSAATEILKLDHSKELESLKQEYTLDISKRKYKYESKMREYYSFMNELDSFHGFVIDVISVELAGMMSAYYESDYSQDNQRTIDCNRKGTEITSNLRNQEAKLYSQINGLKLSAPDDILLRLEELRVTVSRSRIYLERCIEYIFGEDFRRTRKFPQELAATGSGMQNSTLEARRALLEALRKDLDNL
ncbi:hypothetical protein KV580_29865 [Pseudomonas chlororaphis]|nr:hypothetical protein [Pseudomonas chlororaphis]